MNAVINILRNNGALTSLLSDGGNSIFANESERLEEYSYITIDDRLLEGYKAKDRGSDTKKMQYFIKIYAKDYPAARAISNAIETALDYKGAGTFNGETITSLYLMNHESYPAKIENRVTFIIEHEYQGIVRR